MSPPATYSRAEAGASVVTVDGRQVLLAEAYVFTSIAKYPANVSMRLSKPGTRIDLIAYDPTTGHGLSRLDIGDVPVVVVHGLPDAKMQPAMQAWLVLGDYLIHVDAVALPVDQLVMVVNDLIEHHRSRLEANTLAATKGN